MPSHQYPPIPEPILNALGVTLERFKALGSLTARSSDAETLSHLLDALNEQFEAQLDAMSRNVAAS